MVYKRPNSKYWWYKFTWDGEVIRQSTKQANKRVAEQMEAAHRTSLAKGEVGIREKKSAPTLDSFAEKDFLPYTRSTFASKLKTLKYYEYGVKALRTYDTLATLPLDSITTDVIAGYVAKRREAGLEPSSINRELQSLRRMFTLALEWGKVEKALPKVRMLSGENHRERVLTPAEEALYLKHASPLLHDVAIILLDCGLRPEECFRLQWANVHDGVVEIQYGKTDNARRRIPMSQRVAAVLEMRKTDSASPWVFPASTKSGHMEPCTVKKPHLKACKGGAKDDQKTGKSVTMCSRSTCTRCATPASRAGHRTWTLGPWPILPGTGTWPSQSATYIHKSILSGPR
jgi:integrase